VVLACLAQVFEEEGALDRLEAFVSAHGAAFYDLPPNKGTLELRRRERPIQPPDTVSAGRDTIRVFASATELYWTVSC
jgi:dihydroorotase